MRLNKFAYGLICSVYCKRVGSLWLKKLAQSSFLRLLGNYAIWLRGQAVKTPPFHGGNTGSSPVGVILKVIYLDL